MVEICKGLEELNWKQFFLYDDCTVQVLESLLGTVAECFVACNAQHQSLFQSVGFCRGIRSPVEWLLNNYLPGGILDLHLSISFPSY